MTKGTISQIVKRLEVKGLVVKNIDLANNTRLVVQLTGKGRRAYQARREYHERRHRVMEDFLNALDKKQLEVLENFLTHAKDMIEDH